jgi:hypothetical protein
MPVFQSVSAAVPGCLPALHHGFVASDKPMPGIGKNCFERRRLAIGGLASAKFFP